MGHFVEATRENDGIKRCSRISVELIHYLKYGMTFLVRSASIRVHRALDFFGYSGQLRSAAAICRALFVPQSVCAM